MSVIDLHPEDLIDKWSEGGLSDLERDRLSAHVATCAGCRFELRARQDFAGVAGELPPAVLVKSPVASGHRASSPDLAPRIVSRHRGRARRKVWLLGLAAALVGSVSLAALVARVVGSPSGVATPSVVRPAPRAHAAPGAPASSPNEGPIALDDLPLPEPSSEAAVATAPGPRAASVRAAAVDPAIVTRKSPSAAELFQSANQARRDGNASRAIALYRSLEAEHPSSEEARLSYATLARMLLDRGDARSALEGFDHYLSNGGSALGEEALVGRALALQKLGGGDAEAAAWRDVLGRFPRSVHARLARSRLADLGAP